MYSLLIKCHRFRFSRRFHSSRPPLKIIAADFRHREFHRRYSNLHKEGED